MFKNWAIFVILLCLFNNHVFSFEVGDTLQVRELAAKARKFINTNPDSLLYYSTLSLNIAETIGDEKGIAESMSIIGVYHWVKGEYPEALKKYVSSKEIYASLDTREGLIGICKMNGNIGMMFSRLGEQSIAIKYHLEALKAAEAYGYIEGIAANYNSLGVIYRQRGDFEDALASYKASLASYEKINDFVNVAGIYTNIGRVFQLQGDYETALIYHNKSLHLFDSLNLTRGMIVSYNNIGEYYLLLNKINEAEKYYSWALDLSQTHGFTTIQIRSLAGLGATRNLKKDYKQSIANYTKAIDLAKKHELKQLLLELYKGISKGYMGINRPDSSVYFLENYIALNDSIHGQENESLVAVLKVEFELEKKNADIALLLAENRNSRLSRNLAASIAGSLSVLVGLLVFGFKQKSKKDRKLLKQQEELHAARQAFSRIEIENQRIREEELKNEIEYKNRSLTTYTLNLVQKNSMLEEVKGLIQEALKRPQNSDGELKKMIRLIDFSFSQDKNWDGFKTYFEQVHPDFFKKLKDEYPQLSSTELRMCALIRLSLSIKECASILGISPDSIKVARHRIRKKLGIAVTDNLEDFFMNI
jgi:tetratricopeptide (TPR) repeat protein